MKVLLVDDDPAILEVLRAYLQGAGFSVLEAQDGEEALLLFPQADLVVLDLMLPKVDGWRVAEAIRAERPELPILCSPPGGRRKKGCVGWSWEQTTTWSNPSAPRRWWPASKPSCAGLGSRKSSPLAPFAYCPGNGRPTWTGHPCPFPGWSLTFSLPWPSIRAWCSAGKGFWKRSGDQTFPEWTEWWTCTSPGFGRSLEATRKTPGS